MNPLAIGFVPHRVPFEEVTDVSEVANVTETTVGGPPASHFDQP